MTMFHATKRLEGRSEKTLFLYRFNIEKMLEKSDKNVCVMNLLGHEKIDTTLHYAMVKQSNVKMAHKKYIG